MSSCLVRLVEKGATPNPYFQRSLFYILFLFFSGPRATSKVKREDFQLPPS